MDDFRRRPEDSMSLASYRKGGKVGGSRKEHPVMAHKGEVVLTGRQAKKLGKRVSSRKAGR